MSRRTSEANKAIAVAWERERKLVSEGMGTRDWTPEQQQDIIERGKAYDAKGRAFEGQHMKSVEMYPECQGNPDNIQFLTKEEHLAAHDGKWSNPTNWYYDPSTRIKTNFGEGPIISCEVIRLTEPLNCYGALEVSVNENEVARESREENVENAMVKETIENGLYQNNVCSPVNGSPKIPRTKVHVKAGNNGTGWCYVKKAVKTAGRFVAEHKGEFFVGILTVVGTAVKAAIDFNRDGSSNDNSNSDCLRLDAYANNPSIEESADVTIDDDCNTTDDRSYPSTHASPCEHTVPAHRQRYGKDKVWKEKDSYTRGKKGES